MIYFVQAEAGGLIKIGASDYPATRLRQIQSFCPIPLRLLGVVPGIQHESATLEVDLHCRFHRFRAHGEWFEPTPGLLAYIRDNAISWTDKPERTPRYRATPALTQVYASPEFRGWVCTELVEHTDLVLASLVFRATAELAEDVGFDELAPTQPGVPPVRRRMVHRGGERVIGFQAPPNWRSWLNRLADHLGQSNSRVVCQALSDLGERLGMTGIPTFLTAHPKAF